MKLNIISILTRSIIALNIDYENLFYQITRLVDAISKPSIRFKIKADQGGQPQ
jgi:hypothetical protein